MSRSRQLALEFRRNAKESSRGHYKAADSLQAWHGWVGGPAAVLSAIVATTIFATLTEDPGLEARIVTALLSFAAAALAALQLFFKYDERSSQHRASAASYAALRRELDQMILCTGGHEGAPAVDGRALVEQLERMRLRLDDLATSSPLIRPAHWKKAKDEIVKEDAEVLAGSSHGPLHRLRRRQRPRDP